MLPAQTLNSLSTYTRSGTLEGVDGLVLNDEQQDAIDRVLEWLKAGTDLTSTNALAAAGREFRLGGYAGTGKTTLIKYLIKELRTVTVAVCAFTGKAAFVLRTKGIPFASTIHSLIYEPHVDEATGGVKFILKQPHDFQYDLVIVDEASMVSYQLYNDLKSFNKPILFVGDPGQLEPVGDNPNLMKETDYTLKEIQRQALNSPIIALATAIRTGGPSYDMRKFGSREGVIDIHNKVLKPDVLYAVDQVITAKNATRQAINTKFRRDKGYGVFDGLHEGEKLIVTKNDIQLGVFNGQTLYIHEIIDEQPKYYVALVKADGQDTMFKLPIWSDPFYRELNESERPPKDTAKCDFGYCITCHKAQGSEWDHVLVADEFLGRAWDMARWRYTAVTRAAKRLNIAM